MKLHHYLCVLLLCYFTRDVSSKQTQFERKISGIENLVHRLDSNVRRQNQQIKEQDEHIKILEKIISQQSVAIKAEKYHFTPGTYIKSTSGCLSDELTLTCPSGQTIFIDKAEYGEYSRECASTCCTPHPFDCIESMASSNPDEWLILKLTCDNRTSCSYLYQGSTFVGSCTISNLVDYVNVYYSCLPVPAEGPIGFTAYNSVHTPYNLDDIVVFDRIITNIGNHYNEASGIFICPIDGVYIFGFNVLAPNSDAIAIRIMKDSASIASGYGDNVDGAAQTGSTTSIVECNTGEQVWVRCMLEGSELHGNSGRYSTFYGYLLHRQ